MSLVSCKGVELGSGINLHCKRFNAFSLEGDKPIDSTKYNDPNGVC